MFRAARFPQQKLFSFEKQSLWDTICTACLDPGLGLDQQPCQTRSRCSQLPSDKQHKVLSATTMFLWLAPSLACLISSDLFLCFSPPLLPNVQFACLVYKSKAFWGIYFSNRLFALAETPAGFSRALTYNSLTVFFCLKHSIFLSDSEHFRT